MTKYISTTETARMIRQALKAKFPGFKFSVRSSKYAGGSSIRVSWTDGPTAALVDQVVQPFSGSAFDGMIDMKYSLKSWILPDGTVALAQSPGTGGQMGSDPGYDYPAPDGAELVSFGADFIFTERSISDEAMARAMKSYAFRYPGDELAEAIKAGEIDPARYWEKSRDYSGIGEGSQYGGDCVLRAYAGKRMVIPAAA